MLSDRIDDMEQALFEAVGMDEIGNVVKYQKKITHLQEKLQQVHGMREW